MSVAGDWEDHGSGVFSKRYSSLALNVGAVDCGGALLVVDTREHHQHARALLDDLRRLSPHPVGWVVNSHHHWDHCFGNRLFLPAPIWGHERCVQALRLRGEAMRREAQEACPELAEGLAEVVITPPTQSFSQSQTLTPNGRTVELRYLGRGHTDNDIVVFVPDAGVLFAGDLVEESGPPVFDDAFPLEWPDTAAALLAMAQGPVVPGHGEVVDRAFVAAQQRDLAEVARLAVERHHAGMSVQMAAARGGPFPRPVLESAFARVWPGLELSGW